MRRALVLFALAACARRLGVPFRSGGNLTASKVPDAQAAYESANTFQPTLLAGACTVVSAALCYYAPGPEPEAVDQTSFELVGSGVALPLSPPDTECHIPREIPAPRPPVTREFDGPR